MPLVINTNISSLNAQRHIVNSSDELETAMERLSSGRRINTAADDAAGLAISNRMTSQVRGLNQAIRNANDGISMIQTAEGALNEVTNIMQRMRELAIQSANGIYSDDDRLFLDAEVQQLIMELDRIASATTFNGQPLLDGTLENVELQVGSQAEQTVEISVQAMDPDTLGMGSVSVDVLGDEITSVLSTVSFTENDLLINGQHIGRFIGSTDTFKDLLDSINENVLGIEASGYTSVEAETVGDGILENGNRLRITVTAPDGSGNNIFNITDTNSAEELVDKINEVTGGIVSADLDDDDKLILINNAGSTLLVEAVDSTGALDATASSEVEKATGIDVYDPTLTGTSQAISFSAQGQVILKSEHGDPITIERGSTGSLALLESLGFRETNVSGVIQGVGLTSTNASTGWGSGDVTINGVVIDKEDTDSLQGKINAINNVTEDTGVVAVAFATATLDLSGGDLGLASGTADQLVVNGVLIDLDLASGDTATDVVDGFNKNSDLTGVVARLSGSRVILESDQGLIQIGAASTAANSIFQSAAAFNGVNFVSYVANTSGGITASSFAANSGVSLTVEAGLKLISDDGSPISVEIKSDANSGTVGLINANVTAEGRFGVAISQVSIATQSGAQKAIVVFDRALVTINEVRSQLGAANNRLDFTINNLMIVSENTSAARSRIMDADFAAETAALSRTQVLQRASQAMLAQANARSQDVLQLLQN